MATPNSIHTASPRATNRLARFFDVNPAPDSGFSIRMFLRTGTVEPTVGLRVCPQGNCDSGARVCFERARLPLGKRFASVLLSGISARSQLSRVEAHRCASGPPEDFCCPFSCIGEADFLLSEEQNRETRMT